jgi:hypothetical protein
MVSGGRDGGLGVFGIMRSAAAWPVTGSLIFV